MADTDRPGGQMTGAEAGRYRNEGYPDPRSSEHAKAGFAAERDEEEHRRRLEREIEPIVERVRAKGKNTDEIDVLIYEIGETRLEIADLSQEVEALTSGAHDSDTIDKLMGAFCDPGHVLKRRNLAKGEDPEPLYSWQRRAVEEVMSNLGLVVLAERAVP